MQTRKRAKAVQFGKKEPVHVEEAKDEAQDKNSSHESTEVTVSVKEDKVETHVRHGDQEVNKVEDLINSEEDASDDDDLNDLHDKHHHEQDLAEDKPKSEEEKKAELQAANDAFLRATEESGELRMENREQDKESIDTSEEDTEREEVESEPEEDVVGPKEVESENPPVGGTKEERVASKDSFSFTDTDDVVTVEKKKSILFFFVIAFLAFIVGLGGIAGGYYLFKADTIDLSKISLTSISFLSQPTPTEAPEPTAEPTQKPVDLKAYTIRVLNGSGVTGEASKLKAVLTDAGFTVGETGNADTSDYTETVISAQTNVDQGYLQELTDTLKKTYTVDATVKTVPSVGDAQVTVTIGSETAQ